MMILNDGLLLLATLDMRVRSLKVHSEEISHQ